MADDSETGSVPNAGRPKRPPPTLELAATNVIERHKAEDPPPAEEHDTAPSDMPPPDATEPAADEPAAAPARKRPAVLLPLAAGAVAGAIVAGAAWFALTALVPTDTSDTDALAARITQLEARPLPKPDPRIDALDRSIAALRTDINQLKAAPRSTTAVVDLGPITERLNAIERATGDLKSSAAQQSAKPVDDTALRRTVAASLLDTTVRQNEPYAGALAAVKPLASDGAQLQPLDAFAASGVPSDAALSRELLALLPQLAPKSGGSAPANSSFVERLQAGAAKLVRIERTDAGGVDRSSPAARAAAAARSNDVTTAKRELLTLPQAERAPVQPWLDKLAARDAALAASRQFAADAMAALSKPAP